jgi:hypothetical protein
LWNFPLIKNFSSTRVASGGAGTVSTNQTFTTAPYQVQGARATNPNNIPGATAELVAGGEGQTFVTMRYTGVANAGFDFRVEVFTSSAFTKGISLLLLGAGYFFIKLVS